MAKAAEDQYRQAVVDLVDGPLVFLRVGRSGLLLEPTRCFRVSPCAAPIVGSSGAVPCALRPGAAPPLAALVGPAGGVVAGCPGVSCPFPPPACASARGLWLKIAAEHGARGCRQTACRLARAARVEP